MKRVGMLVLFASVLLGCNKVAPVYWENIEIRKEGNGVEAVLNYPYRFGGVDSVSTKINMCVENELKMDIDDSCPSCSLDSVLTAFIEAKGKDSILLPVPYAFNSDGVVYRLKDVASVKLEKVYYTGGANNDWQVVFLNFDMKTGDLLSDEDMFTSVDELTAMVQKKFAARYAERDTTDRFVLFDEIDPDKIPLAANIGLTPEGVVVFYNLYEIAPRSSGQTEIVIPYSEIRPLLKFEVVEDK